MNIKKQFVIEIIKDKLIENEDKKINEDEMANIIYKALVNELEIYILTKDGVTNLTKGD